MFLVIFAQGVFFAFNGHFAWWAGEKNWWLKPNAWVNAQWWMQQRIIWLYGEWWVNSSIAFFVGMIYANFEEKIVAWFKKCYWIKLVALLVLWMTFNFVSGMAQWKLGYWSEYSGKGP
jgi:TRAP-type mannitol/chloroaromatic compound transport system permease small subunit